MTDTPNILAAEPPIHLFTRPGTSWNTGLGGGATSVTALNRPAFIEMNNSLVNQKAPIRSTIDKWAEIRYF